MKSLLLFSIIATNLFAFNAEIKNASVKLKINEKTQTYKAGQTLTLKAGDIVCFLEGEGRVVLKGADYEKQLSKRNQSCRQLPLPQNSSNTYLASAKNAVFSLVADAKEQSTSGVSRRNTSTDSVVLPHVIISKKNKYIKIESEEWGPLPVKLEISSSDGKLIEVIENEDELTTSFIVPVEHIHQGDNLKILNRFEDVLMEAKIEKIGN